MDGIRRIVIYGRKGRGLICTHWKACRYIIIIAKMGIFTIPLWESFCKIFIR